MVESDRSGWEATTTLGDITVADSTITCNRKQGKAIDKNGDRNMIRRECRISAIGSALSGIGLGLLLQTPASGELIFTDITAETGVALPGMLTESLAWGDYDDDGDQDLYLTNDGPNKLFRNDGGGVFTEVASAVGVDHPGWSVGAAFGDLDRDGDLDLYVVNFGGGIDALYRNDGPTGPGGAYSFSDVAAAAGVTDETSSRGVTLFDYDQDGLIDLYVNAIGVDILYHNLGGLTFEHASADLGIIFDDVGVGVVASDIDNNGWVDLFVGNRSLEINRLWLNDQGVLTESAEEAGIDKVGEGMGVLAFDYDNDLDMDLYWTSWPGANPNDPTENALYQNVDGTSFVDVAIPSGTSDPLGWGVSCNAGDFDNDGFEDFFVSNGAGDATTPNVLFYNNGDGTFSDTTSVIGGGDFDGRGIAFADFDQDGDLDICLTGGPVDDTRLWRNDTVTGNHWVSFSLAGTCSNRGAIGARIEVETDLRTTVKEVSGGAGRGSQNSLPVEFGLGEATSIVEVRIRWPNGIEQTVTGLGIDAFHRIEEPCVPASADPTLRTPRDGLRLHPSRPNPMVGSTAIAFDLPREGHVLLGIFDTAGREVRRLVDSRMTPEVHSVVWDGRDDAGRSVGTGIYLVRFETSARVLSRKTLVVR